MPPQPRSTFRFHLAIAALLLSLGSMPAFPDTLSGQIVSVADGDTVTLLTQARQQIKIRISGIDAPEKRQAFGERSRQHLAGLTFRQHATADCRKTDRYGRSVCVVTIEDKDVGLEQIKAGLAWWYRQYAREQTPEARQTYEAAEQAARSQQIGVWSQPDPIPPWEWRREKRTQKTQGIL